MFVDILEEERDIDRSLVLSDSLSLYQVDDLYESVVNFLRDENEEILYAFKDEMEEHVGGAGVEIPQEIFYLDKYFSEEGVGLFKEGQKFLPAFYFRKLK